MEGPPPSGPAGLGLRPAAGAAGAILLAGILFASPSLLVCGCALALLVAGAAGWVGLAARSTRLERLPGPSRMEEDELYPLRVRVRRGAVPLPIAELSDPLLPAPVPVSPRQSGLISVAAPAPRRGRHVLGPATLILGDPLGMCRRELSSALAQELLVLPRIEPVRLADPASGQQEAWLNGLGSEGDGAGVEGGAVDLEMDGVRPYRPGSPASRIHWRTVARSGEMYERRFVAGADAAPLIALDLSAPAGNDEVDRAVRAAASLCVHLARKGGCAILISDRATPSLVDPRLRSWPDVHARLALARAGDPPPRPRHAQGRLAAFWVTASPAAGAARTAARRMPGSFLVSPAPLPNERVAFTVAGCAAQRSGAAMRQVAA
jgi:uncharacterized protein (DUF58 family)